MMHKKGLIGTASIMLIGALVMLFIIVTLHTAMSEPQSKVYDSLTENLQGEDLETTEKLKSMWNKYPIIMVLVLFSATLLFIAYQRGSEPTLTP